MSTLLLFVLLFGAMYFFWLRPQRRKLQQRQADQIRSIDVGDEVVTQSGIVGTIVGIDDDRAQIQVSQDVVLTVVRAAIGRRVEPVAAVPETPDVADDGDDIEVPEAAPDERGRFWQRRNPRDDA